MSSPPPLLSATETQTLLQAFPQGLVALDVESTGLSPLVNRITELAAVKLLPTGELKTFQTLIDPQVAIPPNTIAINQITDRMVQGGPTIQQILPDFLNLVGALPVLGHNAKFDLGFLIFATHKCAQSFTGNDIYCSCKFARKALPQLSGHGLAALADHFGLPRFQHHRALADAEACLQVFARCLIQAPQLAPKIHALLFNTTQYQSLANTPLPPFLTEHLEHIQRQTPLLIHYNGGSLKMHYRPIKPSSLLPLPSGPVLYGLCLVSEQYKSFSLKKLKGVKLPTDSELEQSIMAGKILHTGHCA